MKNKEGREYLESKDIITETTLHDILLLMNDRIMHIEDTMIDVREVMIKLVKQSNEIVSFLKAIDQESDEQYIEQYGTIPPSFEEFNKDKLNNKIDESESIREIQNIVDGLIEKNRELKELEKELEKHKDKIVPGVHGES
jgi:hypothetical protein